MDISLKVLLDQGLESYKIDLTDGMRNMEVALELRRRGYGVILLVNEWELDRINEEFGANFELRIGAFRPSTSGSPNI